MKQLLEWYAGGGARSVLDGEDGQFLGELHRLLCDPGRQVPEEAALHGALLAKAASVLPELARDAKAVKECLDLAERIAAGHGLVPLASLLELKGASIELQELQEQAFLTRQLQELGPTLYWNLLLELYGEARGLDFDVIWDWFSMYATASKAREFFVGHSEEISELLELRGGKMVSTAVNRIERRRARTAARGGRVMRQKTSAPDLIVGFAAFLLDHLAQNLPTASWMGGLLVLSEREGKNFICWAGDDRFVLPPGAAKLLIELGDARRVEGDDRHFKQLEDLLPPIRGRIRHSSIQGDHRTTVRGVGLVGRVIDLVTTKS